MEQRISLITLGVADLERARAFYQRLGWEGQEVEETVFIQPGSTTEVVDDCGSEHANTLLSRENTTCQGSVSSAKKGIR